MTTTKRAAMSVDIFGTTITITFSNGKDLAIDVATLTPEIQQAAMLHGIKQKLVDAAAIARNTENGASAPIDKKYDAVHEVCVRLTGQNPTWNKERSTDKPEKSGDLLVRALMQMTGRDKSFVEQFLSAKTKEQRAALKKNPRVLSIIAELQAASGTNGINTDELLSELGADIDDGQEDDSNDPTSALTFEEPPKPITQQVQEAIQTPAPKCTRKPKLEVAA